MTLNLKNNITLMECCGQNPDAISLNLIRLRLCHHMDLTVRRHLNNEERPFSFSTFLNYGAGPVTTPVKDKPVVFP